jgi:hypothetical protein
MAATVVLDIFSGMPNPQWGLAPDLAGYLCECLKEAIDLSPPSLMELPGLGYRGLQVNLPDCEVASPWVRFFNTTIENGGAVLVDENRLLELKILETASGNIDSALLSSVISSFK